jgi:hypothetical protein
LNWTAVSISQARMHTGGIAEKTLCCRSTVILSCGFSLKMLAKWGQRAKRQRFRWEDDQRCGVAVR